MNVYRLMSSAFGRPEEAARILPKRVVFLSVEGEVTEKDYFCRLNEHLDHTIIHIEVLRRKKGSGYNDPHNVIELLKEYFTLQEENILPAEIRARLDKDYPDMETYLNSPNSISRKRRNMIRAELLKIGIDTEYRKYLRRLGTNRNTEEDIFGVLIDRDRRCHSKEAMRACIEKCKALGVGCYISNPCFEFWLLLHLCDVRTEYLGDWPEKLLENKKITEKHTTISQEVSARAGHSKSISSGTFSRLYWPKIPEAIQRSKEFACNCEELIDNLGSNVYVLLEQMKIPLL